MHETGFNNVLILTAVYVISAEFDPLSILGKKR